MLPDTHTLETRLKYRLPKIRLCLVNERHPYDMYVIRTPRDAEHLLDPLRHRAEEHFVSLHLNAKHEVIGIHEVSHGTLNSSLVHPREVFKAALLANTLAILVCHNHPSGSSLSATQEDLDVTKQLVDAGKLIGIPVLDHLVIGPVPGVFSIRENHPRLWGDA